MDGLVLQVYIIRDSVAEMATRQPVFTQNEGVMLRSLADMVNGAGDNDMARHPEHFSVWQIGTWHQVTGVFTPVEGGKVFVKQLVDLKAAV